MRTREDLFKKLTLSYNAAAGTSLYTSQANHLFMEVLLDIRDELIKLNHPLITVNADSISKESENNA